MVLYGHGIDNFFYYYGYWGVDFFLFVSGFGIAHSLENNTMSRYFRNRIKRLFPYCLAFGAIRALLYYNGIHGFTPKFHPSVGLVVCSLDLWYIEAVLILYSLAPIFKKITDHMAFVAFFFSVLICFTIKTIEKPVFFNDYLLLKRGLWAFDRLPVFVLGLCMYKYIDRISQKVLIYSGLFLLIAAMIIKKSPSPDLLQGNLLFFVCLSTSGVSFFIGNMRALFDHLHLSKLLLWLGKNSLYIYLIHEFVYWSIYNHLPRLGSIMSFTLSITVVYTIVTLTNIVTQGIITLRNDQCNSPHL